MVVKELNPENFEKKVKNSEDLVIIDFFANWCGPCKMMSPVFDEVSDEQKFEGKLKFMKLDTDKYPELAQNFQIQGIPAFIITKKGEEVDRIVGALPKEEFEKRIEEIISN